MKICPILGSVTSIRDAGFYSCAAVSPSGSVLARAEVKVTGSHDRPPPIIQLGPTNQTLETGDAAQMPCEPTNDRPGVVVTWLKDGVPIETQGKKRFYISNNNQLTIKGTE